MIAVYVKRTTWDTKKLEGYAVAHPEIVTFKKESASVTIRGIAQKEKAGANVA